MKFKLLCGLILALNATAYAANKNLWASANNAFQQGNINALSQTSKTNPSDEVSNYLYASLALNHNQAETALEFVNQSSDNYFRTELTHQLLNFYFNNQSWAQYIKLYPKLSDKQVNENETCGYDVANFALKTAAPIKSDLEHLIANKMPLWCTTLVASKLYDGSLPKANLQPFLYNLVTNEQTAQFNQLAETFHYSPVKFSAAVPSSKLNNPYQIVYRIAYLSGHAPEAAYAEASNANVNKQTKEYLFNIIASDLAIKQMLPKSLQAIAKASDSYVSDEEYEWRVRSFLAVSDWSKVVDTINAMPEKLQNKNAWLYWKAYAMGQLGQKKTAYALLGKIPRDYNYYSLLAQSELRLTPDVVAAPPSGTLSDLQFADEAGTSFELFQLGKQINSGLLIRLATQSLYYVIAKSPDQDIAIISHKALTLGWNEMSIYAATKISQKYAVLSFPILFSPQYQKYSQANGIDMSYPMAITRQESRFNPNALAFDGGVGLMQIMPATASYIAKKSGSSLCYKSYECNIKFGTWYLTHLYNQFGNNIIYATAGYNAGPGRAHHWQQTFHDLDNRIQIELIPFKITRDYVQKVLTNKVVYDSRLDENKQLNLLNYLNKINNRNSIFIVDDDDLSGDASAPLATSK